MKRALGIVSLLLASTLVMASCGKDDAPTDNTNPEAPAAMKDKMGSSICDEYLAFLECTAQNATENQEAAQRGYDEIKTKLASVPDDQASQLCTTSMETLKQNRELVEQNGCTLGE